MTEIQRISGCFRHQVLLRRYSYPLIVTRGESAYKHEQDLSWCQENNSCREDFPPGHRPLDEPSLLGWCFDFPSKSQCKVTPHEIVVATKEFQVIFETFLTSSLTDRSATQIRRALSNREIQPFHKR